MGWLSRWLGTESRSATSTSWLDMVPAGGSVPPAESTATAARCIDLIAGDCARLPIELRRGSELLQSAAVEVLSQGSPMHSGFELRRQLQADALTTGNGFAYLLRDSMDELIGWRYLQPTRVAMLPAPTGASWRLDGEPIDYADLLHIRARPNADNPLWGVAPLQRCRTAAELATTQDVTGVEAMKNAGLGKIALVHPASMAPEAKASLSEAYVRAHLGARNLARPLVLSEGIKVEKVSDPFAQSAWLDSRRFSVAEIGRAFGVPGQLLFSVDGGTLSSVYEAYRLYVDSCLTAWAAVWASELTRKLAPAVGTVQLPTAQLLRSSASESSAVWTSLVAGGIATRNEARAQFGLPPLAGLDVPTLRLDTAPAPEGPADG